MLPTVCCVRVRESRSPDALRCFVKKRAKRKREEREKKVSCAERKRGEGGDREKILKTEGKKKSGKRKKEKETKIWECNTEKKGKRLREKKGKK
jgi:hypothetical protein